MIIYRINYSKLATKNLKEICDYYDYEFSDGLKSNKIFNEIISGINSLVYFPRRYPLLNIKANFKKDIRKFRINKFLVLYFIDEDNKTVNILYVIHIRKNLDRLIQGAVKKPKVWKITLQAIH